MTAKPYVVEYLDVGGEPLRRTRITATQPDLFDYLDTFARTYARSIGAASVHVRDPDSLPQAERPEPSLQIPWRNLHSVYGEPERRAPKEPAPGGSRTRPVLY